MAFYTETLLADSELVAFFLNLGIVGIIISFLIIIFWIYILVDLLKRDFKKDIDKLIWFILLLTTFFFGAVLYYFIVKTNKKKTNKKNNQNK
ncbi:MAG: PLDc N-terminal domain-containing protein [Candidatus Woesearchaeota archaeon]